MKALEAFMGEGASTRLIDFAGLQTHHPALGFGVLITPLESPSPPTPLPEAVKKFNGRDALLRVHNRKPNPDAGHRVPTGSGSCGKRNFFTASRVGARGAESSLRPHRAMHTQELSL